MFRTRLIQDDPAPSGPAPLRVLDFWRRAGPELWFAKDEAFDRRFRERFAPEHGRAAEAGLKSWEGRAEGALALVILLDQYPRNAFRGTARMYATDAEARRVAAEAIGRGFDRLVEADVRVFFYLPFGHSESLADQERAVALCASLGGIPAQHSRRHRDIVKRFGRFPHRNAILGRESTPEERDWLADGGFAG